jgi:hypothetical protein
MQITDGIRTAVEAVDREVSRLAMLERAAVAEGTALNGLCESWGTLLGLMAVHPPAEVAKCAHCGRAGESGAVHCWTCWEELESMPPDPDNRRREASPT